ncbi:MAG: AzlC family ABC transporter permease [bacterium]|nr:AzlC family ABC transporter permease [bacterium]
MNRRTAFATGVKDGIPICLGYLAVSFTFGIMAKNANLSVWEAVLISATNVTSAGQFAGLSLITAGASYLEMAFTQLIINLRYCLMSCALSQKLSQSTPFFHRFFIAYGVTDEIFGISVSLKDKLHPFYSYGAISVAVPGWVMGTFLGIVSGNILPERVISALSVALYGMFIAIIIPPARGNKVLAGIVAISMAASLIFAIAPVLCQISSGFRIIILTIVIAGIAAALFPVTDDSNIKEAAENES